MKAVILAGGVGTRLRPYTITIPKPLLPIGDMSAIELLIRQLARDGIRDICITVAYKANLIQAMLGSGETLGVNIRYVTENEPLGTAGCLSVLGDWFDSDVLVCNGDLLTNMDFASTFELHRSSGADISICVREQQVDVPYGVVEFDDNSLLTDYREKPTLSYWVSMGVYVLQPTIASMIKPGERLDMPDLHQRVRHAGRSVQCLRQKGIWYDIGAFQDYDLACQAFAESPDTFLSVDAQ